VEVPFLAIFVGLLVAYLAASARSGLDSRYPILMAVVVLLAAAILAVAGYRASANTLAEYVFLLLAGGIALLAFDDVRPRRWMSSARRVPVPAIVPENSEREGHSRH
jgi:hypothetical protein